MLRTALALAIGGVLLAGCFGGGEPPPVASEASPTIEATSTAAPSADPSPAATPTARAPATIEAAPRKLTLREYAAWCDDRMGGFAVADATGTWGDLAKVYEHDLGEHRAVNPPDEIKGYHLVRTTVVAGWLAFVRSQDPDGIANLWEALAPGLLMSGQEEEAEDELSPEARAVLSGHCFDGDSAAPSATPFPSIADSLRALPNPLAPASPTPPPVETPLPTPVATPPPTPVATPTPEAPPSPAAELAAAVLTGIAETHDPDGDGVVVVRDDGSAAIEVQGETVLEAEAFALGMRDSDGEFWMAITGGPPLSSYPRMAVVAQRDGDSWATSPSGIEFETYPFHQRVEAVIGPIAVDGGEIVWIAVGGFTGAHSGAFELLRFDGERLTTAISYISHGPDWGEVVDLDGDGEPEIVLNVSNRYVLNYASGVTERAYEIWRREGAAYRRVELAVPDGSAPVLASAAARVVRLAEADLWREAAVETARLAPSDGELRWLSILVNRTAAARLEHAGSSSQPLLTHVLAGEYGPALDLMRAGGPLIADTGTEWSARVIGYLLDYTGRALEVRPGDASIHAVRALGLALESPDDLSRAHEAMRRAHELAPADVWIEAAGRSCGRRRTNAQARAATRGEPTRSRASGTARPGRTSEASRYRKTGSRRVKR